MGTPNLAWITPATDKPAELTLLKDGELTSHPLDIPTMTKLAAQLAIEIRNAVGASIPR